ncbi:hypothetical protein B296_00028255 [Ensete ventricosum]|uniref:Uncharacterized protein n=1 Tax=Ensete ventricosum TaxID=4639 RepID=A0A426ZJC8_ENSVE|nr:hypothetical protein B296_00028255 [Ensete ventricosum]
MPLLDAHPKKGMSSTAKMLTPEEGASSIFLCSNLYRGASSAIEMLTSRKVHRTSLDTHPLRRTLGVIEMLTLEVDTLVSLGAHPRYRMPLRCSLPKRAHWAFLGAHPPHFRLGASYSPLVSSLLSISTS